MADEQRTALGPAGAVLLGNIKRIREGQRLTYVELAGRLAEMGRPIPVLGLRRIEKGERRVDVDDLLALAAALGVTPVDLLVPNTAADDEPYSVTPQISASSAAARDWIGGHGLLRRTTGSYEVAVAVNWMPKERGQEVARKYIVPMSDAWLREEHRRRLAGEGEDE